jgi:predicted enzyme related to lactoylglutathione lyase
MKDAINWFELPVVDLARAKAFYERLLGTTLKPEVAGDIPMAIFPQNNVSGALIKDARRKPTTDGALIYLNANGVLDACIARIESSGGKVLLPKTDIGDPGHIALFLDTEGNAVGLHSERA